MTRPIFQIAVAIPNAVPVVDADTRYGIEPQIAAAYIEQPTPVKTSGYISLQHWSHSGIIIELAQAHVKIIDERQIKAALLPT